MQEFGDFANIDVDKLIKGMDQQVEQMEEFQRVLGSIVGTAQDEDGFVTIEYGNEGVRELELHPKAMRLSSGELAELIKAILAEATEDFQKRMYEAAGTVFGDEDNPMQLMKDPDAAIAKVKQAEAVYDRAFEDVMGELDQIRRRMDL
ncbi:YbaB/EbfC family nucleoid-associated protein [Nonomuraea sp. NPDC050404]|uniref:YbaB/EbfC family nucleoid-associated protein n=1 Tax=Nonomuraea sp. NPDC050404 TaxID=3155783 RepID=UPI0033CD492B